MAEILNTHGNTPDGVAAPEGHDEAMLEAIDKKNAELEGAPKAETPEPEKLLGKFETVDDLTKAYQELERKLSGKAPDEPKADEPNTENESATDEEVNKVVETAGLDVDTLAATFYETGDLAEADYEALAKAGISRELVEQHLAGVNAQAELYQSKIFNEVGGEENFKAMASWAASNMSEAELTNYNNSIESSDFETVRSAVELVNLRYQQANGKAPNLILGDGLKTSGDVFESIAQLTSAMRDPRYEADPAYRKSVEQRLSRSDIM